MEKLIEWTNELSVGLDEIDEQHKILVNLLNELHKAITEKKGSAACGHILDELIQYTIVHFAVEESLMRIFDYPYYEEHKGHHKELTDQVLELQRKFRSGQAVITFELMGFLRKWLTVHIMKEDKLYGPFFLERGVNMSWAKKKSWLGRIWESVHG